jgi:ABC-2 type transport system permease protein
VSAASALTYLAAKSACNRLWVAARRLRNPRQALPLVLGLVWVAGLILYQWVFARHVVRSAASSLGVWSPSGMAWFAELGTLGLLLISTAFTWLWGSNGAALRFTNAEIQMLFPAPLTRRQLVNFRLARDAAACLVPVVVVVLLFGRGDAASQAIRVLGGWITLTTFSLHSMGASLTRVSIAQHGVSGLRRRLLTLGVAALVLVAAAVGLWRAPALSAFPFSPAGVEAWTRTLLGTAPLAWALYPIRVSLGLAFSQESIAVTLPGALMVLAVHYLWVIRSDAAFEDAAVDAARSSVRRLHTLKQGIRLGSSRRGRLRLAAIGRPEVALLWKATIRITRFVSIQTLAFVISLGIAGITAVVTTFLLGNRDPGFLAILCVFFQAVVVLCGPMLVKDGVQPDVAHLEILRSLPLRGRQIIVGELAMPALVLTAAQWILLVPATLVRSPIMPRQIAGRLAVGAALAIMGPVIMASALLARRALMVVVPAWMPREGDAPISLSRSGVGVASMLAGFLAEIATLLVVALGGGGVLYLLWPVLGLLGAPIAALVAAAVVTAGLALAVTVIGEGFDRIEPEP